MPINCVCLQCGKEFSVKPFRAKKAKGGGRYCGNECKWKSITTHGNSRTRATTPEYHAWISMKSRCCDQFASYYHRYGGRGIRVCEEWIDDFAAFLSHMGARPTEQHSLDRVDSNGHYEPGNCRWATPIQQSQNTCRNSLITFKGETLCHSEWARRIGITPSGFWLRIKHGWSEEKAITTPNKNKSNK